MSTSQALRRLLQIDQDTVIDSNWFGYFIDDQQLLEAILELTGCADYAEVVDIYEGCSINQLIEALEINTKHL